MYKGHQIWAKSDLLRFDEAYEYLFSNGNQMFELTPKEKETKPVPCISEMATEMKRRKSSIRRSGGEYYMLRCEARRMWPAGHPIVRPLKPVL
jgi:hypothetical protein